MVTIPVNYPERACDSCGELFKPKRYATTMVSYCSQSCRNRAYYQRLRNTESMEDEPSPFEWDGSGKFSEPVAPPQRLVACCLACGERYAISKPDGHILRCGRCQGPCLIEPEDIGMGSPDITKPISIRTLTRSRSA